MAARLLLIGLTAYVCIGHAVERLPDGGGPLPTDVRDEITPHTYRQLHQSPIRLPAHAKGGRPTLAFPLRQAVGETDAAFHGISNFVDQDPAFPDQVLDFECNQRTYDLESGYNHRGVDFFTWPFSWQRMENDDIAVIAAAPGVISAKRDSEPDRSCGADEQARANYVVLRHDDGSESIYLHLKTGSATKKLLGERVDEGEYLGIVGSSGFSSGPHLHFEVHDPSDNLIEPYAGICNTLNVESWWQEQLPYYDSRINRLATHSQPPEFLECPQTERPNFRDQFAPGDQVILGAYYHDQRLGQETTLTVLDPDGNVFTSFTFTLDGVLHYNASYWWWPINLPVDAVTGAWTFRATYEGNTVEHKFAVGQVQVSTQPIPDTNAEYAGLWYSPALEGEGFNLVPTASGLVV